MTSQTKPFIGTKIVNAVPMTRAEYNVFRDWTLPSNENGDDEGYLVEYTDGGKANTAQYKGYVSWSPKEQFDNAYRNFDGEAELASALTIISASLRTDTSAINKWRWNMVSKLQERNVSWLESEMIVAQLLKDVFNVERLAYTGSEVQSALQTLSEAMQCDDNLARTWHTVVVSTLLGAGVLQDPANKHAAQFMKLAFNTAVEPPYVDAVPQENVSAFANEKNIGGALLDTVEANEARDSALDASLEQHALVSVCAASYDKKWTFTKRAMTDAIELDAKLKEMIDFFDTSVYQGLSSEDQALMQVQAKAMRTYLNCLRTQIATF